MTVVQAGAVGARKLKALDDGVRKQRMLQRAVEEAERFGFEFLPRALDRMSRDGWSVKSGQVTAEERIRILQMAGLKGEALEAAMRAEGNYKAEAKKVFAIERPSKSECKQALSAWNQKKARARKC
jgi:hypothetical protein